MGIGRGLLVVAALIVGCKAATVNEAGIRNFSRIEGSDGYAGDTVGFGGATPPSSMGWLRDRGFRAVVNLRLVDEEGADVAAERAAAEAAGLVYIHVPFDPEDPDPKLFDSFATAVGSAPNQPVYIHCNSANRVGALWMILRVLKDGWDVDAARDEARKIGLSKESAEEFALRYIRAHR